MKITEQEIQKIKKLRKDGMSIEDIMNRTHACKDTIRKYLKEEYEVDLTKFSEIMKIGDEDTIANLKNEYLSMPNDFFCRKYKVANITVLKAFGAKERIVRNYAKPKKILADFAPMEEPEKPTTPIPQEASIKLPFSNWK